MALLTVPIPIKTYNIGTSNISSQAVPAGSTEMDITLDVTNWTNPASVLQISMEFSMDNGVTWQGGGSFTSQCGADGTFRSRTGTILTSILNKFSWPSGVDHVRGTIVISGASIRTGGSIVVN